MWGKKSNIYQFFFFAFVGAICKNLHCWKKICLAYLFKNDKEIGKLWKIQKHHVERFWKTHNVMYSFFMFNFSALLKKYARDIFFNNVYFLIFAPFRNQLRPTNDIWPSLGKKTIYICFKNVIDINLGPKESLFQNKYLLRKISLYKLF